jgi:hypothetical protein
MTALSDAEYLPKMPLRERVARGEELGRQLPHEVHASWQEGAGREDPVTILEKQAAVRLPELVPIRHARMTSSAFAHFRGAAAVMAAARYCVGDDMPCGLEILGVSCSHG